MAKEEKEFFIGGQAVINGVLMKSPKKIAVAVRDPKNKILIKIKKMESLTKRNKFFGLPFLRGIIIILEMLFEGIKALNYSANVSIGVKNEKSNVLAMIFSFLIAIVAALVVFKFIPLFAIRFLSKYILLFNNNYLFVLSEGILKIAIFVLYVYLISFSKEVYNVFMYHGAEHKTIYCYESKKPLTKANIRKFSTKHPRCGTSFIFFVLFLSILLYSLIPNNLPFWKMYAYRIILLPVLAGISYEVLKFTSRFKDYPFFKVLIFPGIWIQHITTKEPTDNQIEVAIAAIKKTI